MVGALPGGRSLVRPEAQRMRQTSSRGLERPARPRFRPTDPSNVLRSGPGGPRYTFPLNTTFRSAVESPSSR